MSAIPIDNKKRFFYHFQSVTQFISGPTYYNHSVFIHVLLIQKNYSYTYQLCCSSVQEINYIFCHWNEWAKFAKPMKNLTFLIAKIVPVLKLKVFPFVSRYCIELLGE